MGNAAYAQDLGLNTMGLPGQDPADKAWQKIKPGTTQTIPGYGTVTKNKYGSLEWQGGVSERGSTDGVNGKATAGAYQGHVGEWDDSASGAHRYGVQMNGGVGTATASGAIDGRTTVTGTAGGGTFGVDAWAGEDGFGLGGQANEGEASVELKQQDKKRADDEDVKVGLSEGLGLGVRGHWGDADHDGHPEYGFGFDVGPVSVDMTSEDPLKTAIKAAVPGSEDVLDAMTDNGKQNLTDNAVDTVSDLGQEAVDGVADGVEQAKKAFDDIDLDPSSILN